MPRNEAGFHCVLVVDLPGPLRRMPTPSAVAHLAVLKCPGAATCVANYRAAARENRALHGLALGAFVVACVSETRQSVVLLLRELGDRARRWCHHVRRSNDSLARPLETELAEVLVERVHPVPDATRQGCGDGHEVGCRSGNLEHRVDPVARQPSPPVQDGLRSRARPSWSCRPFGHNRPRRRPSSRIRKTKSESVRSK